MQKAKRVLITGGAGFIGSHLADKLINEGYTVIVMDNLITGSLKNIEHLFPLKEFEFYNHDVTKFVHIPGELDFILHFASPASPNDYLRMPIHTLKVGSLGTHNLLGLAKEKRSVFLIASTSEIYGDPLENPQAEEYWGNVNPIGPRGVYDEAKRFMEAMTMAYHRYHNIDIRIARIFNTFGPRMRLDDGRAIPNFMVQALKNEDITVYGDGNQFRSFCYIDDLVEGIFKLMLNNYIYPINLGYPEMITLNSIAEEIIKLCNSKSKIVYKPLPEDDPKIRKPDIAKAKQILNWEPKINRQEGLKRTLEYFRSILK